MTNVTAGNVTFGNELPFVLISGPCQLENLDHARMLAETLAGVCADLGIGYVFKASFDKANRSSLEGRRGTGIDEGLTLATLPDLMAVQADQLVGTVKIIPYAAPRDAIARAEAILRAGEALRLHPVRLRSASL